MTLPAEPHRTTCCIAGGGPAGMMLGYLLARAGIAVTVLEKHGDFLRDFRGDTIHPSTLELMAELGLLDRFLELPHSKAERAGGAFGDLDFTVADFSHLPTRCKFVAFMPQWDFLNFLAAEGRRLPPFDLRLRHAATGLLFEGERVAGVRAEGPDGPLDIRADLTVGADGRHSSLRGPAGLAVTELGAPLDVLWFRLPRRADEPAQVLGRLAAGKAIVLLDRGDYWQCGLIIAKDSFAAIRARGLDRFRAEVAALARFEPARTAVLTDWEEVKLLSVQVNRLDTWHRAGLLMIGDAAHAMSPVGGIGINLAIQDAVAAANLLAEPLRHGPVDHLLARVQARRDWPTRATQRMQVIVQNFMARNVLGQEGAAEPPFAIRLLARFPFLRRLPARIIGMGFRPEHVRSPAANRDGESAHAD